MLREAIITYSINKCVNPRDFRIYPKLYFTCDCNFERFLGFNSHKILVTGNMYEIHLYNFAEMSEGRYPPKETTMEEFIENHLEGLGILTLPDPYSNKYYEEDARILAIEDITFVFKETDGPRSYIQTPDEILDKLNYFQNRRAYYWLEIQWLKRAIVTYRLNKEPRKESMVISPGAFTIHTSDVFSVYNEENGYGFDFIETAGTYDGNRCEVICSKVDEEYRTGKHMITEDMLDPENLDDFELYTNIMRNPDDDAEIEEIESVVLVFDYPDGTERYIEVPKDKLNKMDLDNLIEYED